MVDGDGARGRMALSPQHPPAHGTTYHAEILCTSPIELCMPPFDTPTANPPTAHRFSSLLTIGLALCLLTAPGAAEAKQTKRNKADTSETAKKKGVTKVTYQRSPSEESRSERDRRMHRECKGMHNAGACLGYTR